VAFEENPASNRNKEIVLYDVAFDSGKNLSRILAHEFSHELYRHMSLNDLRTYNLAVGWIVSKTPNGKQMFVTLRDQFVADDGVEGPSEDFSNNLEYFLFSPAELKAKNPRVYDWIQNKFGAKFKVAKGLHD